MTQIKSTVFIIILLISAPILSSCGKNDATSTSLKTSDSITEASPTVTGTYLKDDISEVSSKNTSKPSKDSFDSATNDVYSFSQFTIEIPSYWTSEQIIPNGTQRFTDNLAMIQICPIYEDDPDCEVNYDSLLEDNDNMLKSLTGELFNEVPDYEMIDTGRIKGILYRGTFEHDGVSGNRFEFTFPSEEDRNWCFFSMVQSTNTVFDYEEDYLKMIYSIKKIDSSNLLEVTPTPIENSSFTEAPTPTETPTPTEVPTPTEMPTSTPTPTPVPTATPKPTKVPVPTATPTPDPPKATVILPDPDSKLGKDLDSKSGSCVYYINVDGSSNVPKLSSWGSATITDGVAEYLNDLKKKGFTVKISDSSKQSPYAGYTTYYTSIEVSGNDISWSMELYIQKEKYIEYELDIYY